MNLKISQALPQWCVDIVANPPRSGEGVHSWLFRAARALRRCGRTEGDITAFLGTTVENCGRYVPAHEIADAIRNSHGGGLRPALSLEPPWPHINNLQREAVTASGLKLVDLWELSRIRLEDNRSHTEEIIDTLFPGDPLLCSGRSNYDFATRSREEWRGQLAALQLLVPNPMTARVGRTQDGKESSHALEVTGPRRFLVIEQDVGTIDEQAAVLLHLAERAPLALAVHSGSKSVHGWFYCVGQPEERLRRFMRYAVNLGADRSTWTRSQFVRMPDGVRNNGQRQAVYFFNPSVVK